MRLLVCLLLSGCAAADLFEGDECFRLEDCEEVDGICFLAQCVDPGFEFTSLTARATPPSGSGLLEQEFAEPLRLEDGYQTLSLSESRSIVGVVRDASGERVPGTVVANTPVDPSCAGLATQRQLRFTSVSSTNGFNLRLPEGTFSLTFVPDDRETIPPLNLTPPCGSPVADLGQIDASYPALTQVSGRLRQDADVSTGFVADASVSAVGTSIDGGALPSSEATSDSDGRFTLTFAGAITELDVEIGPTEMANLVPSAVFSGLAPVEGTLAPIVVGLAAPVALVANLAGRNEDGSPSASVSDARLVLEGQVGTGTLTIAADATANQGRAFVRPGLYDVVVIPRQTSPFAISATEVEVPVGEEEVRLSVVLGRRVPVSGRVVDAFSTPVRSARVVFRSRQSPVAREFSATTDVDGRYSLTVDPSIRDDDAEYEVSIEPARASALPLQRELVRVEDDGGVIDFALSRSSFVFGQVLTPDGRPAENVLLDFFSNELELEDAPLFVGSAQADSSGEFALPVPVPPDE